MLYLTRSYVEQKIETGVVNSGYGFEACRSLYQSFKRDSTHWPSGWQRLHKKLRDTLLRGRRTCAHHPLTVITDSDTLTSLFEFEVLQKLDAIGIFGIVLQAAFSLLSKPFW